MTTAAQTETESYSSFIESDARAAGAALREQMREQGYLFFRHVVPEEDVMTVRRDALELIREYGWLDPACDLMDAVVAPGMEPTSEGQPPYMAMYRRLLKLPRFHGFPCHPGLMAVADSLLEAEVLVHPRRIGRVTFPNYTVATTPAHQDHFYIRGTVETYSCWTPLGTCPRSLGSLAVMPGSHKGGFREHSETHPGAVGGRGVPVDESTAVWHTTDFEPGDALFFHSFTVHKALPNLSGNRLRLSTDNRYQRSRDYVEPDALLPHFNLQ